MSNADKGTVGLIPALELASLTKKVFEVKENIWKGRVRKDANQKNLGLCYRSQRNVQTTERKDLSVI